ncbi:hypothetical protein A0H81_08253 [Grifola frondosa]|uniref:Zn(2)-C6 fungal-type domain-containing protein n=1 Tax=Grifola frondosa TaxID=5627 RepID=A0A1C7M5Y1_GRIFR|nr:hypothetical protein A0H81_08253 [Grifola frondosa]
MSNTNSSSSPNSASRSTAFDPSLLQPIVRSKRTPIACTECRRRQVKCSGTTPRCERCQKRGIECVYIPLNQQRSASATAGGQTSRAGTPQYPPNMAGHAYVPSSYATYPPAGMQSTTGQAYVSQSSHGQQGNWRPQSPLQTMPSHQTHQYTQLQTAQGTAAMGYSQTVSPTQMTSYNGQYYQGDQEVFDPVTGTMVPHNAGVWQQNTTEETTYPGYQGRQYP